MSSKKLFAVLLVFFALGAQAQMTPQAIPLSSGACRLDGGAGCVGPSVVTLTGAQTLTNKRINPRTGTTTSSATPSINTDNVEFYSITALAVDITGFTMTGTPVDGQRLVIAITGTGTRAITWGSSFESSSATLPTSIGTSRLDVGFVWNSVTSKWRCVAKV